MSSFDPELGKTVDVGWTFQADGAITGPPVVAGSGDTVFAATTSGTVYAIRPGGLGNRRHATVGITPSAARYRAG